MSIKKYTYNYGTIKTMLLDSVNNIIWLFFNKINNGKCHIVQVSAGDLYEGQYDVEIIADTIVKARQNTAYLYVALTASSVLGTRYSKTNPFTDYMTYGIPANIAEDVVSMDIDSNGYAYFLTPGILSSENAKIYVYTNNGVYTEMIDLVESGKIINNAIDMTIDTNDDIWIITSDTPAKLVRVYFESGGWKYTVTEMSVIT
jgi:hypothetical protein